MPSFLTNFREFTSGSEVHPNHAMWSAFVALAAIAGKRISIDQGHFTVYPNLYVVLVSPPGSRKSTSLNYVRKFLQQVGSCPTSSDCTTKESLVATMKDTTVSVPRGDGKLPFVYTPVTILATELSEFIGASKEGMINLLTTMYDYVGLYEYKTLKRGSEAVPEPCINLLGCTTPAWITARLRDDIISGGFSRRAIFSYEDSDHIRIAFPEITAPMERAWIENIEMGKAMLKRSGAYSWDPAARSFFKTWYDTHERPADSNVAGYFKTKHMLVMKLAMLIALSESQDLVLQRSHIEFAMALLEQTETNLSRVFEGIGRNELNSLASRLVDIVRVAGGLISRKKAENMMYAEANEREIAEVVRHCKESGKVIEATWPKGNPPAPVPHFFSQERFEEYKKKVDAAQAAAPPPQ